MISCGAPSQKSENKCYRETKLGFFNPFDKNYSINNWIRKPENIRTLHETFKKYGYSKIFSNYELDSCPCMIWSYINKSCTDLIDSLILTYPSQNIAPKYYKEFWLRRKNERNDTTVYSVLKEIKEELLNKKNLNYDNRFVNDTIYNLLRIKLNKPISEKDALINFHYLTKIGLDFSAYNLLYERYDYQDFNWDRDKLKKELKTDTVSCNAIPFIEDDTK